MLCALLFIRWLLGAHTITYICSTAAQQYERSHEIFCKNLAWNRTDLRCFGVSSVVQTTNELWPKAGDQMYIKLHTITYNQSNYHYFYLFVSCETMLLAVDSNALRLITDTHSDCIRRIYKVQMGLNRSLKLMGFLANGGIKQWQKLRAKLL